MALLARYALIAAFALMASCGGSGDTLASVAGEPVTVDDFLEAFQGLPPDRQVAVLEPGGRMALVQSIITKRLLDEASVISPAADESFWVKIYSDAWLSDSLVRSMAVEFDPQEVLTGLDSSVYLLTVALLPDSAAAAETADLWNSRGPSDPGGTLLAPWSMGSGTGFRLMSGPAWQFPAGLVPLLSRDSASVIPMYGAWAVGMSLKTEVAAEPDYSASMSLFGWELERAAGVSVSAGAVNAFLGNPVAGFPEDGAPVASWAGGSLSPEFLRKLLADVRRSSFPDSVPGELASFAAMNAPADTASKVWFLVMSASRTMALADLARSRGASVPAAVGNYARIEALVRERAIRPAVPDSSGVMEYYDANRGMYCLPGRRSVLLGYVEEDSLTGLEGAGGFDDLRQYHTMADSSGNPVPTPLQPAEAFGTELGGRIFQAQPGEFCGPVITGGGLAAYFQVVEVAFPDTLPLSSVYGAVEDDLFRAGFDSLFASLVDSLAVELDVEVDTAAVERVDPWAASSRR
jgi:hypothetical protein